MKKKGTLFLLILLIVSLSANVFFVVALFSYDNISIMSVFNASSKEHEEAYQKGWSHWFSGYGMNGEGMQYIDYYEFGRKYNSNFNSTKEAFVAGYRDAFYYVNHHEANESYDERINDAYYQYYSE